MISLPTANGILKLDFIAIGSFLYHCWKSGKMDRKQISNRSIYSPFSISYISSFETTVSVEFFVCKTDTYFNGLFYTAYVFD